ncbi:MAG: hypothetical protein UT24_C0016G0042 [Candidatus Woesebacteria bacterium GW2011_GWB1_39_12]|uniref:Uncharacterized protein n=1 Tax=Candidatus Woesebacteria bacterium GW2011_GWB1_39_12 TaxID=1618574 RepID=A0A0G0MAF4_9BACT|nr:MAG: hypothetical protein UT24_C0016G0042 [Candidatus Woesebacteria bacterium GW2011_GWB1_39_12]
MKNLREEIIEILGNGVFKGKLFEGQCGFWADTLLSLFKQQMKEEINKIEKLGSWEEGNYELVISHEDWKSFRKKLLKNIEGL